MTPVPKIKTGDPRKGRAPKAVKVTPPKPTDSWAYRSRPTAPDLFGGDPEPPFEGTLAEVLDRHADDEEAGLEPVVEYRTRGSTWTEWRRPLLLSELHQEGLAEERSRTIKTGPGDYREETRWEVTAEGWARLREAERS